ncbi:MAG: hypothetical protein LBT59_23865 [Clostridiales bacterium]|jgi:hypothetical protein|nr:hypothetical protein [Clostridiales bacterium]
MEYKRGRNACETELKKNLGLRSESGKLMYSGFGTLIIWYLFTQLGRVNIILILIAGIISIVGSIYYKFGLNGKIQELEAELERLKKEEKGSDS